MKSALQAVKFQVLSLNILRLPDVNTKEGKLDM